MPFAWTQAAIDLLFKLHIQEGKSAAETARALGDHVTRNAVLGKIQRLGWSQTPKAEKPTSIVRRPRLVGRTARLGPPLGKTIPLPRLREVRGPCAPKPWTERRANECAFPVGDPVEPRLQLSCCARTGGMSPYCPAHRALMRLPDTGLTEKDQDAIAEIARRAA